MGLLVNLFEALFEPRHLTEEECAFAVDAMLKETWPAETTGAFLAAMRAKGATGAELAGFAKAIRRYQVPCPEAPDAVDLCGTGGGPATFNISTAASFVVAGAGVRVAKHGNRAVTSKCGSADVLEEAGIALDPPREDWGGFAFFFAPHFHPSLRLVGPIRRALGFRTIFNQLGPLLNPARVRRQVVGVYEPGLLQPMAEALQRLGAEHAWVTWSEDGLDEVSPSSPCRVIEVFPDRLVKRLVAPSDFGLESIPFESIPVPADTEESVTMLLQAIIDPMSSASQSIWPAAAAALYVAGRVESLRDGIRMAKDSIHSASALQVFQELSR